MNCLTWELDISTDPDTNMMKQDDLKEDVKVAIEEAFEEMRLSLEQQHSRFKKGQRRVSIWSAENTRTGQEHLSWNSSVSKKCQRNRKNYVNETNTRSNRRGHFFALLKICNKWRQNLGQILVNFKGGFVQHKCNKVENPKKSLFDQKFDWIENKCVCFVWYLSPCYLVSDLHFVVVFLKS